jgi:GAF domain-containing protein
MGMTLVPGTDQSKSMLMVPIVASDRVMGTIALENYETENAYTEANVRFAANRCFQYGCCSRKRKAI